MKFQKCKNGYCLNFKSKKDYKDQDRYNQVPHLTQDTTWESSKSTINITHKSQEVNPFPAGDHKAASNRRKSMQPQDINNTNDPQRSTAFEQSV